MTKALGIVNFSENYTWVDGLEDHRSIAAVSFLGRYRVIDFPLSNFSNSGIDRIQVYARRKPGSLVGHLGVGHQYNINSKSGFLRIIFTESTAENDYYNTDIKAYSEHLGSILRGAHRYVVIAPGYMVYAQDFDKLIQTHEESGADISLLYHRVNTANTAYLSCDYLALNPQKGVRSITRNDASEQKRNIFMDTYVMRKEVLADLIAAAQKASSMYTLRKIVSERCAHLDVRGVAHKGFFGPITDFKSYYDANMALLDLNTTSTLFHKNWPIYTKTSDSSPVQHLHTADVRDSLISNGCWIAGAVEHSIVGRGCKIHPGAVVRNCIMLAGVEVGDHVHLENQVVDKYARIIHMKNVVSNPDSPGYIKRNDSI